MINNIRLYTTLSFCLLIVCLSCQRQEEESVYVSVPDKSITPIKHFKRHEIKMKCGRTVKFTIPAEFSDKYSSVGHAYFSGVGLVEKYHYGIKDNDNAFFSILSYEETQQMNEERLLDSIFIRERIMFYLVSNTMPVIEKKASKTGQIFYFIYVFEVEQPIYNGMFTLNNYTIDKELFVRCYCQTTYNDTTYGAELAFRTNANHFDFPTYRKIMESVEIR